MTKHVFKKIRQYVKPEWVLKSEIRVCNCCNRKTLVLKMNESEEFWRCIRCKANQRYEILAQEIRKIPDLSGRTVVEMDVDSPLRRAVFHNHPCYTQTYFDENGTPGEVDERSARCEDITEMSFLDGSVDLLITSDILEHVPNLDQAFSEMKRVLKPGGKHIFTIPMMGEQRTEKRAGFEDGKLIHYKEEAYHCDPSSKGNGSILVFWDFREDIEAKYSDEEFKVYPLMKPFGIDKKMVWCAEKLITQNA